MLEVEMKKIIFVFGCLSVTGGGSFMNYDPRLLQKIQSVSHH